MQVNSFKIIPADSFIWNKNELLSFLSSNQGNDILLDTNEEGCCLQSIGLYKILDLFTFNSVNIITANPFEYHSTYKIIHNNNQFKWLNVTNEQYSQYHTWNKNKIFGAIYNRAIWHRIGIASHLHKNHLSNTILNFRSNPTNEDNRALFEIQKLFNLDPPSINNFMSMMPFCPITLKNVDDYTLLGTTNDCANQMKMFYPEFLIDIVAETFTSGKTFFVTEKTVRPMLLKKPFIVMGPKCFLIHLRQMGFKTFYDFWDEDYDGFEPTQRYKLILKLIDFLSTKSKNELFDMYANMKNILDHNYNLLQNKSFLKTINYTD